MRFVVKRTSVWDDDKQPCQEAYQAETVRVDERVVNKPEKLSPTEAENWYKRGQNHRVDHGHIMRDFPATVWFVDLNTLEELTAFVERHGEIVFGRWSYNQDEWGIEIYDDYRE